MTQSDSPDFEFDISDLEVESVESSPSNDGEAVSREEAAEVAGEEAQVEESQAFSGESETGSEEDEERFDGFAIDEIPDAFDVEPPVAEARSEEGSVPVAEGVSREVEAVEEVAPVSRVEEKPKEKPSRTMGEDDLGADVFAEIDSDSDVMSFDDVIDDLMEEVEEFEAGGFVEMDEDDSSKGSEGEDGLFKMEDPDDSLGQSVDPNAVEEEAAEAEPAFPRPPVDFEIPADPEPEVEAEVVPDLEGEAEVGVEESIAESVAEDERAVDDVPVAEALAETIVEDGQEEVVAKAPAEAKPDFSDFEIPADPVEPETAAAAEKLDEAAIEDEPLDEAADAVDEIAELPADEKPLEEPVVEDLIEEEPVAEESKPAKGRENVFYSAEDEEEPAALEDEQEEDLSDLLAAVAAEEVGSEDEVVGEETGEAESVDELAVEDSSDEGTDVEVEAISSEVADEDSEDVEAEGEVEIGGLSEEEESEEDISDLLAAVSEQTEEEEADAYDETASVDADAIEEEEPAGLEVLEDEPEAGTEVEIEPVEEAADSGLSEVEEEDTDLSDLISSISEQEDGEAEEASNEDEEVVSMPDPSSMMEAAAPGLAVIEDEEEEIEIPVAPGLSEVPDEEESEEVVAAPAMPTAEDLLRQAGSLLNGDSDKPEAGANALLDALDDDDGEIVAMPSPDALISDAVIDDDEEVVAMPDPLAMMEAAGAGLAVVDDDEEEKVPVSGNVADRAGDLPPPPPAPVEIIDDEPPEEDIQPEAPAPLVEAVAEDDESDLQDPFSAEISLDDFNEDLGGLDDLDIDATDSDSTDEGGEESGEDDDDLAEKPAAKAAAPVVAEVPKLSFLWRVTHSLSVAAGLVLIGLASVLGVWKQQIIEYYEGRDIDGSALVHEIEEIGTHALSKFDENGLYRMQWVDSEVRRVSENEIRLHALVGAQLREDLYVPVLESALGDRMGFDERALQESLHYAHTMFPDEVGHYPDKPWDRLYELSAAKDEILSLRVSYGLKRESAEADWELTRIKVTGYKKDLVWPEGEPKYSFGENAYDVDSLEFATLISEYKDESKEYIARVDRLRGSLDDERMALQRENTQQRERVKMALAEGAYFNGVAILGEDAEASRDVQLVITEVRDGGAFVKGVVRMDQSDQKSSKHFVGSLDFETTLSGKEQGILNLTTVSLDSPQAMASDSSFFEPGSVSRMRLKADGFRLEGDTRDLSFRFTRSL